MVIWVLNVLVLGWGRAFFGGTKGLGLGLYIMRPFIVVSNHSVIRNIP